VASKKKLKKKAKQQAHIADELFVQVGLLAGQLSEVDEILRNAELPGPTIEAWAQQVRDVFSELIRARGIVSGGIYQQFGEKRSAPRSGLSIRDPYDDDSGEYTLLTDADLGPFSQETRDLLAGR